MRNRHRPHPSVGDRHKVREIHRAALVNQTRADILSAEDLGIAFEADAGAVVPRGVLPKEVEGRDPLALIFLWGDGQPRHSQRQVVIRHVAAVLERGLHLAYPIVLTDLDLAGVADRYGERIDLEGRLRVREWTFLGPQLPQEIPEEKRH